MKCKRCGKVEGFDGSFHTLYCQNCLNELLKEEELEDIDLQPEYYETA